MPDLCDDLSMYSCKVISGCEWDTIRHECIEHFGTIQQGFPVVIGVLIAGCILTIAIYFCISFLICGSLLWICNLCCKKINESQAARPTKLEERQNPLGMHNNYNKANNYSGQQLTPNNNFQNPYAINTHRLSETFPSIPPYDMQRPYSHPAGLDTNPQQHSTIQNSYPSLPRQSIPENALGQHLNGPQYPQSEIYHQNLPSNQGSVPSYVPVYHGQPKLQPANNYNIDVKR